VVADFARRAQALRQLSPRGAPMSQAHGQLWWSLLGEVPRWVQRAGPAPDALQRLARVRAALEAEWRADGRVYGEVPSGVAERAREALALLPQPVSRPPAPGGAAARAPVVLSWPLAETALTSAYGPRHHPLDGALRMHAGVDLAARLYQPVLAAAPGEVVRVGWNGAHGLQVEVQHAGGLRTRYSHLSRAVAVPGQAVGQGDVLGLAGRTGRATGVHLHFEVWRGEEALDPLELLPEDGAREEPLTVSLRGPQ
jgi:murein DD-endopeptidase MepM/ murein hydrolase activator NlpD